MSRKPLDPTLPDNLQPNKAKGRIYYRWRNPVSNKYLALGGDREKAVEKAKELNRDLKMNYPAVVAQYMRPKGDERNVRRVLVRFEAEFATQRGWSDRHVEEVKYLIAYYKRLWGQGSLPGLSTRLLSEHFKTLTPNAVLKHRQFWVHVFKFAMSIGYINENRAERTLRPPAQALERKRSRHTHEGFLAIREEADVALQLAMDVALYSLQRRDDLVHLRLDQVDTSDDNIWLLHVSPGKSEKRGLNLRIKVPKESKLRSALERLIALAHELESPFLLNRVPQRRIASKTREHWTQWSGELLSKQFAKARDRSGIYDQLDKKERPTLHQLRALGAHLYEDKGYPRAYVQALMGHATEGMTQQYQDGHVVRWEDVEAGL